MEPFKNRIWLSSPTIHGIPEYYLDAQMNPEDVAKIVYSCLAIPMKEVIRQRQFGVAFGRIKGIFAAKKRVKQLRLMLYTSAEICEVK